MSRLWILLGSLIWLITIASSATMNFLAGKSLGRTAAEGLVLAFIGLAADGWKALGPIFIARLFEARRYITSALCLLVWITSAIFAIMAALGFVAQNRQSVAGSRMHVQSAYQTVLEDIKRNEDERKRIGSVASTREIDAQISALLAQPAGNGTAGTISFSCAVDDRRTRSACAKIAELKTEISRASKIETIDASNTELRGKLEALKEHGGAEEQDAQGTLVVQLTGGRLTKQDVGVLLVVVVVVMIELISAFAPIIVSEYAGLAARSKKTEGETERTVTIDVVREFLLEKTEPSDQAVGRLEIFDEFSTWCRSRNYGMVGARSFVEKFEQICRDDFSSRVALVGDRYTGVRLIV